MFNAKAVLVEKSNDGWTDSDVIINSVDDIRNCFKFEIAEVRIDKYRRLYYTISEDGVQAKIKDEDGNMHYMSSPLLIVQCDDEKPINISNNILNSIKETIDFF